jgi:hypothetical protein
MDGDIGNSEDGEQGFAVANGAATTTETTTMQIISIAIENFHFAIETNCSRKFDGCIVENN